MEPIKKVRKPNEIIELTVKEKRKFLFFWEKYIEVTYSHYSEKGWYLKGKKQPANKSEILTVLSEFYDVEE